MSRYRLILPKPWQRIGLGEEAEDRIAAIVEEALTRAPEEIPPDKLGPLRTNLEHRLMQVVLKARENGGIDLYLPTDTWHGFLNGSSFLVSEIAPAVQVPSELTAETYHPAIMAELISSGAEQVTTRGGVWLRRHKVQEAGKNPEVDVPVVGVDYLAPTPDEPGNWTLVSFTTAGDGTVDGRLTGLMVDLFDAIMGTWHWNHLAPS